VLHVSPEGQAALEGQALSVLDVAKLERIFSVFKDLQDSQACLPEALMDSRNSVICPHFWHLYS
jgi:hypothetical protein